MEYKKGDVLFNEIERGVNYLVLSVPQAENDERYGLLELTLYPRTMVGEEEHWGFRCPTHPVRGIVENSTAFGQYHRIDHVDLVGAAGRDTVVQQNPALLKYVRAGQDK